MKPAYSATLACTFLAGFQIGAAFANDSSAELSTGGLVFTRNAAIEMRAEDLFISSKEIRVQYSFFNGAGAPITTLVAFPLPDITKEGSDDVIAVPSEKAPENFVDFSTKSDGRPVNAQVEQKAFLKNIEHTALLRRLGVPLAPYLRGISGQLDALPAEARKELLDLHLVQGETEYVDNKPIVHLQPAWTLKTTYYWEQTFPPGETRIEHHYRPSVGVTLGTSIGNPNVMDLLKKDKLDQSESEEVADYRYHLKTYCIDDAALADAVKIRDAIPENAEGRTLIEQRISYILTTGANWAGPIKSFRLVVDKGYPDNIVSFCGDGVRKTSPTTFEMTKTDFTPARNLSILILTTHMED